MRGFGYMLATALVAGVSWTAAEGAPIVLMEDSASFEFGTPTFAMDSAQFYSGTSSVLVTYPNTWDSFGMNLLDGQASIAEITGNPVSFWYRTNISGNVNLNIGIWTTAPVTVTNSVAVNLVGDGAWHEAQVSFDAHANVASMSLDVDQKRDIRFRAQNWGATATLEAPRTINYDMITVVPEPGTLALAGVIGLLTLRRRR